MNLTIYDKTNTGRTGVRSVSMNKRTSLIIFSKRAIADLGWKEGALIIFAKDEDNPKQWFIASPKSETKEAFILKTDSRETFLMRSRGLVKVVLDSVDDSLESIIFLIGLDIHEGADKTKFYPLIVVSKGNKSYGAKEKSL